MFIEDQRSLFLEEFYRVSWPETCSGPNHRTIGPWVSVEILDTSGAFVTLEPHEVYLSVLRAEEKRQGHGKRALSVITTLADQFGVGIHLDAVPQDKGPGDISPSALQKLYESFGFIKSGDTARMYRSPIGQDCK